MVGLVYTSTAKSAIAKKTKKKKSVAAKKIKKKRTTSSVKKHTKKRKRHMNKNEETFIYILQSTIEIKKSYVGVTNCLSRRLRQHNGQLAGGARYTRSNRPWRFHAIFVTGNRHDALSIEWKIKHSKRKSDGPGITGKIAAACRFGKFVVKFSQICGPAPIIVPSVSSV